MNTSFPECIIPLPDKSGSIAHIAIGNTHERDNYSLYL